LFFTGSDWIENSTSPLRVLVTGGCGFIGHHLVRRLLLNNHLVTILDNLSTGRLANLPNHPNIRFVEGSVLDEKTVFSVGQEAQLVFHLASIVGMQQVYKQWELTYQTSVVGTEKILKATNNIPIVLFSSSAVYGMVSQGKIRENQPIFEDLPLTYDGGRKGYASGKWKMEQLGQQAANMGRPVMILRPCNIIGSGQSSDYGMVLPRFIEQAISGKPLTIFDDGQQSRCFSCVQRFLDFAMQLIAKPKAWQPSENVINVGTSCSTSIQDLAEIVLEETGSFSPIEFIPYEQVFGGKQDVRVRVPDTKQLEALIGSIEWPDIRTLVRHVVKEHQEYRGNNNLNKPLEKFI
jgi:UDP-glucose 4-epimerase